MKAYRTHFRQLGGIHAVADARTLETYRGGWRVTSAAGMLEAASAVIALGPWADDLTTRLGYRLRLGLKRGYHMHYGPQGDTALRHPVLDSEGGYVLAPMARGIRLTTGIEFARRNAPKTPVQLDRAESVARLIFPLGERLDAEAWAGMRPCTVDMKPVIGPAPHHENLWFSFGHAHHGLTLAAASGRLLAEMMTGEDPFLGPDPFRADRPSLHAAV